MLSPVNYSTSLLSQLLLIDRTSKESSSVGWKEREGPGPIETQCGCEALFDMTPKKIASSYLGEGREVTSGQHEGPQRTSSEQNKTKAKQSNCNEEQ
jgi:hypothetical protein